MDQKPLDADFEAPLVSTRSSAATQWGLDGTAAADIQGLVVSPFAHLPEASAVFLTLEEKCGGAWLRGLLDAGLITSGAGKESPCGAVALTWSALRRMGLPAEALSSFPTPFQEGMTDPDRQRRLGDDKPAMLFEKPLRWSGNVAWERQAETPRDPAPARTRDPAPVRTPVGVHALLLLYGADRPEVERLTAKAMEAIAGCGATAAFCLPLSLHSGAGQANPPREHFGFADGFSQPLPQLDPAARDKLHGTPVGEVLMGYPNAHAEDAPGPLVTGLPPGALAGDGAGQSSLGLNGSYMVVRQLHQDVAAFRANMADAAARLADPGITADWMAERVIGRERNGDLLVPGGSLPAVGGQPDNNFGYFAKDRAGLGCPVGSHIRRANPRDGLARDANSRASVLQAVNNHRILRRARKYGDPLADGAPDDGQERGLLFMCLQTDIARQFEFVQQTWLLNPVFGVLSEETDPLLGPPGAFTLPADPLRRVARVETFVQLVGGEYFFLPSLRALGYLGGLAGAAA